MKLAMVAAAAAVLLVACGGDDDDQPAPVRTLEVAGASPAEQNGILRPANAASIANQARPIDGAIPTEYCAITYTGVPSSNGKSYQLQVYFRQSDAIVLLVDLVDTSGGSWNIGQIDTTITGVDGVTVDRMARTIRIPGKNLFGVIDATQTALLTGTISFPANPLNNACG